MNTNIQFRPALIDDAHDLFKWVNSPDSLSVKQITKDPISWEKHHEWLSVRLSDEDTLIWIIEIQNKAIGQMRVQKKNNKLYIDIYVLSENRKAGVAKISLSLLIKASLKKWPGETLIALINNNNSASIKTFLSVGFKHINIEDEHGNYQYSL